MHTVLVRAEEETLLPPLLFQGVEVFRGHVDQVRITPKSYRVFGLLMCRLFEQLLDRRMAILPLFEAG